MRAVLVIIELAFCVITGLGQSGDSAYLKISYKLNYITDSTKPYKTQNDLQILFIGANSSFTCSQLVFERDSVINDRKHTVDNSKNSGIGNTPIGLLTKFRIFTSFSENKITVVDEAGLDKLYYEESVEKINWIISADTTTILSYRCQKATASFRGRNYVAWFTKEIPITAGPYKFRGLPGLILSIADTKNQYVFECSAVEKIIPKQLIAISTDGILKTARKDFLKLQKNSFDNPGQMFKDRGITIGGRDAEAINNMLNTSKPYNPIELN
jgi:GLPGLI family protein